MDDQQRRDDGMIQRRKVLGDAWVDKSIANKNSFNADFLDLITRHAWGEIWTRPHFDHRTRRVLVIGTMVALGQWDEFRLHVRAALTEGGFTPTTSRNPAAAGDLLRRSRCQPRREGSLNDCERARAAQGVEPLPPRCARSLALREVRPATRSQFPAASIVRSHAAAAPRPRRPARPAPCPQN